MKHCNQSLPSMVAGSLLGLDIDGILEVTYAFPSLPQQGEDKDKDKEGNNDIRIRDDTDVQEYQIEMMKMLREVNIDNNCVGWYHSTYLGTMYTTDVISYQYSYQSAEDLSENSVVIMYDPIQSKKGQLVLKAFNLTDEYIQLRKNNKNNVFIKPDKILKELPLVIKNSGHISAFIRCLQDSHQDELDCHFDALSLSGAESFAEKHLEMMSGYMDDLTFEQQKFQQYSKNSSKYRQEQVRIVNKLVKENNERIENGDEPKKINLPPNKLVDAPSRIEPLLIMKQLEVYGKQMNTHIDSSFHKLYAAAGLHNSQA